MSIQVPDPPLIPFFFGRGTTNPGLKIGLLVPVRKTGAKVLQKQKKMFGTYDSNPRHMASLIDSLPPHLHRTFKLNWGAIFFN